MDDNATPIEELMNIGATVAKRLKEIDIRTYAELKRVGAVAAYSQISANHPERTMPVCYYLYSLEGALRNQRWDALPKTVTQKLLHAVRK